MRVSSDCLLPIGTEISARHFVAGQWVFVGGLTKGKGFKSAFQRWKFAGAMQRKANKNHRLPGSIGQGQAVGKVEEKFEKYFGYLARCEGEICTTTLKF